MLDEGTALLRSIPFFAGLSEAELHRFAAEVSDLQFAPGVAIEADGSPGDCMYVVVEGIVEIVKREGESDALIARRGPHEVLGERCFIDGAPRGGGMRAGTSCRLLRWSNDLMSWAVAREPDLLRRLYRILSDRHRESDEQVVAELRRRNEELARAYDSTLAGWARALELRDKETEGHCQRVTDGTLALARLAGVCGGDLEHIRRGALLHDIGKMGVPDRILHKPGPLDEEEWVVMRQHPEMARRLLEPIEFLRPALDVPYCHHEKWDGTGYPRGLSGRSVPLSARLFAAADIWDAMASDRVYRKGLPVGEVRDHIRGLSGSHLDPEVVRMAIHLRSESWHTAQPRDL